MKRTHRSAGAIVVSPHPTDATTLLLEQVRTTGERQVVAPKGTIEPGESPLATAAREVREEAGITNLTYIGYIGQQRYGFNDRDGEPAEKTVDWFLFATRDREAMPQVAEGFISVQWLPLDAAVSAATHPEFRAYVNQARDLIAWRRHGTLAYSAAMSNVIWEMAEGASELLSYCPDAGIGLCGSAARGDFVDRWSDIDIIGWGIDSTSDTAAEITERAGAAELRTSIRTSVRLADANGRDINGNGPLYDMKLRAVLRRVGLDVPVLAGALPLQADPGPDGPDLVGCIDALQDSAVRRLGKEPSTAEDRADRARRVLSVTCSAARNLATTFDTTTSLRLPNVVFLLGSRWPDAAIVKLLADYDRFRQDGARDLDQADALAERAPAALGDLKDLVIAEPALS